MKFILLFALFPISLIAYSQEYAYDTLPVETQVEISKDFEGENDTLKIESRTFNPEDVHRLKSDPNFDYQQPPTVAESLWDRFMLWVGQFIESLFSQAVTIDLGRLIIYILAVVLLIGIIMMILRVNAFRVIYSGADESKKHYQVFNENIHEMDFEKLIQEASEKNEFRLATRLIFLYSLKILSDKHLIEFNPGKTNHDFVNELMVPELKTGLNELSFYFEYAWYGNFTITDSMFQKIARTFETWRSKIK